MRRAVRRLAAVAAALAVLGGAFLALAWWNCGFRGCPDVGRLRGYVPDEASVVVGREGRELAKLYIVRRVVVPFESLPEYVPAAFVAIEDEDFWEHHGIDWSRVLAAAWVNLRAGGIEQGFSTITMQLARNLFPRKLPPHEQTLSRKLGEMRVARQIEDAYTKREILEMYLNQIYYGAGAWGIEAASQEYFGHPASELTLAEAATLAALPRAPARLNPRVHPERAKRRRDLVLREMEEQGRITAGRAAAAMDEPIDLVEGAGAEEPNEAPYFVEAVRRRLEEEFGPTLYTGGYTIHTTLELAAQRVAEQELAEQLDAIEAGRYGPFPHGSSFPDDRGATEGGRTSYLQGAVVVMEAGTGDVRAMVGGRDFGDSEFNRAMQADRQPGSAFKPVVYATALEAGYPLTTPLRDSPIRVALDDGDVWTPRNYGGGYMGVITMRQALVQSRNVPTVRLARRVGIEPIVEMANRLGLGGEIPRVPAIALGAAEVTLLEMVGAYAAFATLGERPRPRLVTRVVDADGDVVWRNPPEAHRVLGAADAFLLTTVLRDVVDAGTGTAVRAVGYRGVAAGKTGTTDDATNVWFIGYTPARVTGVWIGFDRPQPILPGATGGELAAPVWGRVMRRIGPGTDRGWQAPPGVERYGVGPDGHPLGPECPGLDSTRPEYFREGSVAVDRCPAWPPLSSDSLLGVPIDTAGPGDGSLLDRLRRRWSGPDSLRPDSAGRIGPDAPPDTTDAGSGRDVEERDDEIDLLGRPVRPAPPPPDTGRIGRRPARQVRNPRPNP